MRTGTTRTTRIALITLIALCLLVLTSCVGGNTKIKPQEEFRYGTNGVDIEFFKDVFRGRIVQNTQINLAIKLDNQGAYDVTQGFVVISTEEPLVEIVGQSQKPFFLRGRSSTHPDGEKIDISFQTRIHTLNPGSAIHKTIAYATVCYDYKTQLTADVCIDTDPYNTRIAEGTKACTRKDVIPSTQGAPIVIEKVEIRTYLHDDRRYLPEFVFHIRNVKRGLAFSYDQAINVCSANQLPAESINKVLLYARLSENVLHCDKPIFQLVNDKAVVTCGLDSVYGIDNRLESYTAPLYVELNYGYSQTIAQEFEITNN